MRPLALVFVLANALPVSVAQQPEAPAAAPDADPFGHSRHGAAFDEGPRQAAYLMAGMNAQVHLPIAGLSAEAQAFFDQGVTQQHGFWYFEAERSFRQVAKLQPDCAMAYWGMAMANVENLDRAVGLIANAVQRSKSAPHHEQLWIDAWAHYYLIDDAGRRQLQSGDVDQIAQAKAALATKNKERDKNKLERQLIVDLGTLVHEFPDDIEAKAFLAVQIWLAYDWGDGIPIVSHAAVDALLDQVLARAPLHPVHHYRVHLWDQQSPERALQSAALLGHSAPGIAHQWHMGGHIFDKLKRFGDAAWQQEASARVDHAHMMRDHVMPFEIHNYGHNQEWLCRSLQSVGRMHEALDLARNMVELPRHPRKNRVDGAGEIAAYARIRLLQVCRTFEMWPELRACCENGLVEATGNAMLDGERLLHLGMAAFRLGDQEAGARALAQFDDVLEKAKQQRAEQLDQAEEAALSRNEDPQAQQKATEAALGKGTKAVRDVRHMLQQLRGEQALCLHDGAAALAAFASVPHVPASSIARAHELAGEHDKAIEVLVHDVDDNKNRVVPLAHLVLALHAGGELDRAKAEFADLRTVAGHADLDSPLLSRLAPVAAQFGLPADWRQPQPPAADSGAADRPPLDELGPFRWSPVAAAGFDLAGADGSRHRLQDQTRPTLVVFYLGFGCLHCIEQLRAIAPKAAEFAAAGIDIVAIGTDTAAAAARSLDALASAERFGFPLLADPELSTFKAWRCYDDFESMPLHGTFLVDRDGKVRWQDISFEPFVEVDWLLGESKRLLDMPPAGSGSR